MKTAGQILKEAREKSEKSLGHIARETRIKEKFLLALEVSDYAALPNLSIAQGFARSYAQAIDVNSKVVTALLRRDFPHRKTPSKSREMSVLQGSFWTPRTTLFAATAITIFILGFYLARQYALFAGSPPLEIKDVIIGKEAILVSGKTIPTAKIEVNGEGILVDERGEFKTTIDKNLVGKSIEIKAISRAGKEKIIKRAVDLK